MENTFSEYFSINNFANEQRQSTFAVSTNTPPYFLSNNFYSPIKPSKNLDEENTSNSLKWKVCGGHFFKIENVCCNLDIWKACM